MCASHSFLLGRAQGLRIAPPEAPSTGYMFGKGVYFSDMASKSANYCYTSPSASQGCLLLCEVALGKTHNCFTANASRLSKQFGSRKGNSGPFSCCCFGMFKLNLCSASTFSFVEIVSNVNVGQKIVIFCRCIFAERH